MSGVSNAAAVVAAIPLPTMAAATAAATVGSGSCSSSNTKNTLAHLTQQLRQNQHDNSNNGNSNSFHLNGYDLGGNLYLHSHDFMADYLAFRQAVRQNKTIERLYVTIPMTNTSTCTTASSGSNNSTSSKNSILSEMIPLLDAIGTLPNLSEIYWNSCTASSTSTTATTASGTATAAASVTATGSGSSSSSSSSSLLLRHDLAVLLRVLLKAASATTTSTTTNNNVKQSAANNNKKKLRVLDITTNVSTTRDDLRQLMQGIRAVCGSSLEKVQLRGFGSGSGSAGSSSGTTIIHDVTSLPAQDEHENEEHKEINDNDGNEEYSLENHPLSLLTADLAHMDALQTLSVDPSKQQHYDDTSLQPQQAQLLVLPPMNASCLFSLLQNLPRLQHLQLQAIRFDSWGCAALVQYLRSSKNKNNNNSNNNKKKRRILAILDLSRCSFPPRVMHGNDSIYTNCNETSLLESLSSENSTLQQLVLQDIVVSDVHQVYKSAAIGLSHNNKTLQRFILEPVVDKNKNNATTTAVVSAETVHALFAALQTSAVTHLHLPSLPKLVQDASALLVDLKHVLLQSPVLQELVLDLGLVSSRVTNRDLQAVLMNHPPHGRLPINDTLCEWDDDDFLSSSYYNDWTRRKNIWLRLNRLGRKRLVLLQQEQQDCMVKEEEEASKSNSNDNKIKQQQQQHVAAAAMVEMLCQVREDVDCSFTLLTEFPLVCNRQLHMDLSSSLSSMPTNSPPPVTTTAAADQQVSSSKQPVADDDAKSVPAAAPLEENVVVAPKTSSATTTTATTTTPPDAVATSTISRATMTAPAAAAKQKKQESACLYNDVALLVEATTDDFRDFLTCVDLDSSFPEQKEHGSVKKATPSAASASSPTTSKEETTKDAKTVLISNTTTNIHYSASFSSPRDAREEIIANSQTTTTAIIEQHAVMVSDRVDDSSSEKNREAMSKTEDFPEEARKSGQFLADAKTRTGPVVQATCGDEDNKIIESSGEEKKMNDDDDDIRSPYSNMDLDPVFGSGTQHWTNSLSTSNDSTYQESLPSSEPVSVASCLDSSKDKDPSIIPACMAIAEAAEMSHTDVPIQEISTTSNNDDGLVADLSKSKIGPVVAPCGGVGGGSGKSSNATEAGQRGLLKSSDCPHRGSAAFAAAGNSLLASVDSAVSAFLTDTLVDSISDAAINTCQSGEQMLSGDNHRGKGRPVATRRVNPDQDSILEAVDTCQAGEQQTMSGDNHRKGSRSTRRVNPDRARSGRVASGCDRGGVGKSSIVTEAGLGFLNSNCVSDAFADTLSDMAISTCQAGEDLVTFDDSHRREGPMSTLNMPACFDGLASFDVRRELARGGVGVDSRDATSTREIGETATSLEKMMMKCLAEGVSMSDALSDIAYGGCELGENFVLTTTTSCNAATTRGYEQLIVPLPEIATNSVKGPCQVPWGLSEEARRRVSRQKILSNKSPTHGDKTSDPPRNQELQVIQSAMSSVECDEDMPSVSTISEGNDHSSYQEMPVAATVNDEGEQRDMSNKSVSSVEESELLNLLSALSHVGSNHQETTTNPASFMEPTEAHTDRSAAGDPTQNNRKEDSIDITKPPVSPPRVFVKRAVAQWEAAPIGNRAASLSPVSHPSRKSNPGRWLEMDKNSEEATATCTTASVSSSGPYAISLGDEEASKSASTIRFVAALDLHSQKTTLIDNQAAQRPPLPPTFVGPCSRALERDE